MSYKLPYLPTINSTLCELADYFEISCLLSDQKRTSTTSAYKKLTAPLDEINNAGLDSEDNEIINDVEDALSLIQDRFHWCNEKYPFEINTLGSVRLKRKKLTQADYCYVFMLLATRFDMTQNKVQNGIDGTRLFEKLCKEVTEKYFGIRSKTILLGTAQSDNFDNRIKNLVSFLNQGGSLKRYPDSRGQEQDGGVDLVVCTNFSDLRKAKVIGLGQCKTGTSWENDITKLNPAYFVNTYLTEPEMLAPLHLFYVAEERSDNFSLNANKTNVFFTRCRIMDFLPNKLDNSLFGEIKKWVDFSLQKISLRKIHILKPKPKPKMNIKE